MVAHQEVRPGQGERFAVVVAWMLKLWREADAIDRAFIVLFLLTAVPVLILGATVFTAYLLMYVSQRGDVPPSGVIPVKLYHC